MRTSKPLNVRRLTIPDDNKCFFHCVNQACFNGQATVEQLKQICARTVLKDNFYTPFLETTKEEYAKAVLHPDFWGGHIEQVIFSRECHVEFIIIYSDGQDIRRVSHAITPPTKRVYLEYCGKIQGRFTHYNLFVEIGINKNPDNFCGVFETKDPDAELAAVLQVALIEQKQASIPPAERRLPLPSSDPDDYDKRDQQEEEEDNDDELEAEEEYQQPRWNRYRDAMNPYHRLRSSYGFSPYVPGSAAETFDSEEDDDDDDSSFAHSYPLSRPLSSFHEARRDDPPMHHARMDHVIKDMRSMFNF